MTLTWFIWGGRLTLVLLPHLPNLQLQALLRREYVTVQHLHQGIENRKRKIGQSMAGKKDKKLPSPAITHLEIGCCLSTWKPAVVLLEQLHY